MTASPPSPATARIIGRATGVGLDRDADLIRSLLEASSLHTESRRPRSLPLWHRLPFITPPQQDLLVFLERIFPAWLRTGTKSVLIPNQERFPRRKLRLLRKVDAIFCKTHHATEIFSQHHPVVRHLGFTSPDRRLPEIEPDYARFLHLAGSSTLKGTAEILQAWTAHPDWPTLTLVIHPHNAPTTVPDNIQLIARHIPEEELLQLQNQCGIHLCPSRSEGWGHYIVEAMSCGAVVLTTDAPPMHELINSKRGLLIPPSHSEPRHLGTNYHISPEQLSTAITEILDTSSCELAALGRQARRWFEHNDAEFRQRFQTLITELLSPSTS